MNFLKLVGLILLAILGIILSPLIIVLIAIVIFLALLFFLISHIINIPKRKKKVAELTMRSAELRRKGIYAYLWYDRNGPLTEKIETDFIPKYKKHLIVSYGDGLFGVNPSKELAQTTALIEEFAELRESNRQDDSDVGSSVMLYILKPNNEGVFLKWDELAKSENSSPYDIDSDTSMKRFDEKITEALGEVRQREIRKKYKGTILGIRNYHADKNEFFVKDLSQPDSLLDFLFEVAEHESDLTPAGLNFVKEYYDLTKLANEAREQGKALPPHGGGKTDDDRIRHFLNFVNKLEPMENAAFLSDSVPDEDVSLFFFYFPYDKKAKAERLAKFLYDTDGFKSSMHILDKDVNPDRDWTLEVYKKLDDKDIEKIHKIDDGFEALAERFGGVYDGHEIPMSN